MTTRIDISYGGAQYSVGDRDLLELQQTIADGMLSSTPVWLQVNFGEGRPQPAFLLLTPGASIALIPSDPEI